MLGGSTYVPSHANTHTLTKRISIHNRGVLISRALMNINSVLPINKWTDDGYQASVSPCEGLCFFSFFCTLIKNNNIVLPLWAYNLYIMEFIGFNSELSIKAAQSEQKDQRQIQTLHNLHWCNIFLRSLNSFNKCAVIKEKQETICCSGMFKNRLCLEKR